MFVGVMDRVGAGAELKQIERSSDLALSTRVWSNRASTNYPKKLVAFEICSWASVSSSASSTKVAVPALVEADVGPNVDASVDWKVAIWA